MMRVAGFVAVAVALFACVYGAVAGNAGLM